jgi:hypothetical protein
MPEMTPPSVSRRGVLLAGLAGASISAIPSLATGALPTVKPLWSHRAYEAFGVCSHPNFGKSVYKYTDAWLSAFSQTGAYFFRGGYDEGLTATSVTVRGARSRGLKWGMEICEGLSMPDSHIVARIKHIAANAADVCLYVEGINEPNYVRGGGAVPSDWRQRTVAKQRLIWQTVKGDSRLSRVKVLGPSLQAVKATEGDYNILGDLGLAQYIDYAAIHRYPGGHYPNVLLDTNVSWVKRHLSGRPVWITETGYTNCLANTSGHKPVPEDVAAVYAPSALLEAVDRGCKTTWYELLDDVDAGGKDVIESNFGMFATMSGMAPPWRAKPVVGAMRSFLSLLKDSGPTYDPPALGLSITSQASDVRRTVTGRRDGSVTVHLRRATDCWNTSTQRRISVAQVPVVLTTSRGSRTVLVDHRVRSVRL